MKQPTPPKPKPPKKSAAQNAAELEKEYRKQLKVKDVAAGKAGANMSSAQKTAANTAAQRNQEAAKQEYLRAKANSRLLSPVTKRVKKK